MTTANSLVAIGLALTMSVMALAAESMPTESEQRPVRHKRIGVKEYQNFLRNWDEKTHPVLYALIRRPAQYDALFHPAPVMLDNRPFAPSETLYKKEQILLVARVMTNPNDMDKVFDVERVTETDQELELRYRFREPRTQATSFVKNYLAVRIPIRDYRKVIFVENGKQVGELNTVEGQWSVPARDAEPNERKAGDG